MASDLSIWVASKGDKRIVVRIDECGVRLDAAGARAMATALLAAAGDVESVLAATKRDDMPNTPVTPIGTVAIMELGKIEGEQGTYDGVGLMLSRAQVRMLAAAMSHADPCITMHPVWPSEEK